MKLTKTRPGITFILCSAALFIAALALPALLQAGNIVQYKIGVLANRGKEQCLRQWQHTALDLQDKIPGTSFTIVPLTFKETEAAVKNRVIDFIITNPGVYVDLEARYDAQRIATLKNIYLEKVVTQFGGVIFTRADRNDISDIEDLKNRTFIAVDPDSFGGWLVAWRELQDHGIHPAHDLRELKFGGTQDKVVRAVQKGEFDAGAVRTDILEQMAAEGKIRLRDFKVLHTLRDNYPEYPFLHSTRLYPEWPFAQLKHTPLEITEQVCTVLLSIQRDDIAAVTGQYAGWTPPLNYQSVHECLKELRYKPYQDFGKITFRDVLRKYWLLLLATAILIGILVVIINYVFALNRKLKQSQLVIKKEEAELRQSEQKLRSIIKESAEGIMLTDEQGMIIEWNRSLEEISGFSRSAVIGRPILDLQFEMAVDEQKSQPAFEQLKSALDDLIKTGTYSLLNRPIDREVKRPDGMRRFVQTVVSAIQTDSGFMIVGFLLDITERKQTEKALARITRQMGLILSSAGEGILGLDSEGRHTFINPAAARMLGYEPQELTGIPSHITWHHTKPDGSPYPVDECPIYNSYRNGIPHTAENELFLRKDGSSFPVEYTSTPIYGDDGGITGAVVTFRNITERKRIEAERERLIAELQKALAQVKTLSGFIPICSSCKKVRNDTGYWEQVEGYISTHSEAEFSHSICPDCAQKLYPEIYAKIGKDKK